MDKKLSASFFDFVPYFHDVMQSLQRVALNKTLITILNDNVDATFFCQRAKRSRG